MDLTGAGTAIMLALAAGLWFLYLVPTWVRRREHLATERRTVRLQAMRVLAESSEQPEQPTTGPITRELARAERELRARQRRADAMVDTPGAIRRRRMRRTRVLASVLMMAATGVGVVQLWLIATTGITLGAWFVLAGTLVAGGLAVAVQRALDVRSAPRGSAGLRVRRESGTGIPAALLEGVPTRPADPAPWQPVAVPPPLYASRPAVQRAAPSPGAAQLVREALAADAPVRPAAPVQPIASAPTSRYAAMGLIDPADTQAPDLDEVLRRRRSAG
ncbi:MAG: hypothetical protein KF727_15540 [Microbacteriaceae bacterium]|nr:hypothetical protein [Microbacteriaceae bacterium]